MPEASRYLRDLSVALVPRSRITPAFMRAMADFCYYMGVVFPVGATAIVPNVSITPQPPIIFRIVEFYNSETQETLRLLAMMKGKRQNRPHVFIDKVPTGRVWLWGDCRIRNGSREEFLWLASNLRWVLEAFDAPRRIRQMQDAIRFLSKFVVEDEE